MIMDAKPRLILALLMSSVMVCMVTLLVTFLDLGLRSDFLIQWVKAYFIAWPVAATTAFFIMPSARRLTDRRCSSRNIRLLARRWGRFGRPHSAAQHICH